MSVHAQCNKREVPPICLYLGLFVHCYCLKGTYSITHCLCVCVFDVIREIVYVTRVCVHSPQALQDTDPVTLGSINKLELHVHVHVHDHIYIYVCTYSKGRTNLLHV